MRAVTTADVARRPAPGTVSPTSIAFSPDGGTVTFLVATPGSLQQRLAAVDVATGEASEVATPGTALAEEALSLEERLRRERARELGVGVTRYAWAERAARLLVPLHDGLWVLDGPHGPATLVAAVTDETGPLLDARITADGRMVGYVSNGEVHVAPVDGSGPPTAVTAGAVANGVTNGLAEYIAQEEMGRPYGFWFSPDGSRLAFCEVDESHVPTFRIVHQGSDSVGADAYEDHAYPFAGAANARVRVGVVPTDGTGADDPVWLDLGCTGIDEDRYVARLDWAPDGSVVVQLESRDQQRLDLVRFDPASGAGTLLLRETSEVWINLHDDLRFLPDGSFVWSSERSGYRHLELRAPDGSLERELTSGPWVVTEVAAADPSAVWCTGTRTTPLERHLLRVPTDGGPPEQLTEGTAVHRSIVHAATGARVVVSSDPGRPPVTVLVRPDGSSTTLHDAADDPRVAELALDAPEERVVRAADGTDLHAALYRPAGPGPHPTIVWVYGGPHAQLVNRSWTGTVAMRAQLLRQEGFCVAVVDNRGSTDRGLAFEAPLHRRMGTVEVDDQVALVASLVADGITDADRVGIYGWSYGGYLSALCLARRPDVFRAACAGAPVTDWDGYDTHYTERYMGTPADNPDGYREAAVATHVEGLRGRRLLLVHGLIDENVHFRHTARLLNALIRAGIDHEVLLFPDERHLPRSEADRAFMEDRILAFFRSALA